MFKVEEESLRLIYETGVIKVPKVKKVIFMLKNLLFIKNISL